MTEENKTTQQKRQVAVKARIIELVDGRYVKEEGWQPNYIATNTNKNISRVNLIGVIVNEPSAEQNSQNLVIDDGSGRISVRSFDNGVVLNKFNLGDVILLIGRPREFGNEKYVVPEIIKKIENQKWVEVRKCELEKESIVERGKVQQAIENPSLIEEEVIESVEEKKEDETIYEKILSKTREMDKGDGVNFDELVGVVEEPNSEKIVNSLLEQGELFEVKPGMLKVLE